jgi:uncharacterized membrane protein
MNRNEIQIIARNSNWATTEVDKALKTHVYFDSQAWRKFLQVLLISLGVGFTVSGIIFFFAYNWADLHKFAKLGMVEGLLVLTTSFVLFSKFNEGLKNVILTGASVLVGVLFAVFGQIYQTGANAYDFFLGWTVFITLWAIISNFPPLWLIYMLIVYTTFVLYTQQVAHYWSDMLVITILFLVNTVVLAVFIFLPVLNSKLKGSAWFTNVLALASIVAATVGIIEGIFSRHDIVFPYLLILAVAAYTAGIIYGLKEKRGFYITIIPFSIIVIIASALIRASDDAGMFFIVALFIVGSITVLVKSLITLQKTWNNAK